MHVLQLHPLPCRLRSSQWTRAWHLALVAPCLAQSHGKSVIQAIFDTCSRPSGWARSSESAGGESRPAADLKVVEKAAELQRQRGALPSPGVWLQANAGYGGVRGSLWSESGGVDALDWGSFRVEKVDGSRCMRRRRDLACGIW